MTLALIIFAITYILLLTFSKYRAYIALASAAVFVILGILPLDKVFGAVTWNVILMIAGTMGLVSLFIESKVPALLADIIIEKVSTVKWAIILLSLFSGIISAFIDNVATVLMVAPVAITICKKLNISPVTSIIAIAIASNLQGAATLVGDTTSIMLSDPKYANLNFLDFFNLEGKVGMFWVVQAGALAATVILWFVLRKEKQPILRTARTKIESVFPSILLVSMIVLLIVASFIPGTPELINGYICVGLFLIGLIWKYLKTHDFKKTMVQFKEIDYFTLLLLIGLFIIIASIEEAGVIAKISEIIKDLGQGNAFIIYSIIVWASVLISAFIDNIPYVATMLPVIASLAPSLGVSPYLLYFGLLAGATLGGNLTPIGASANIAGIGILRKEGYEVKVKEFMKLGVPFTLAAVITGYLLVWFIWS